MINQLSQQLNELAVRIKRITAVNVNSMSIKQATINTGTFYFKNVREKVLEITGNAEPIKEYDKEWQHLIRLAHGNNPKKIYIKLIKKLTATTKEFNIAGLATITKTNKVNYSEAEQILINTLELLLPSAAASYKQGIHDLNDTKLRMSYRGTACEFRESLRETLNHLAPDKDVMSETWFNPEKNMTRPTMKQKVRFILASRGTNKTRRDAAEKTVELIETISGDVARAIYNRASLSAHVETTKDEVVRLKRYMDALLFDLLEICEA